MPLCYAPWTNIDINSQGQISPCCKFRYRYYTEKHHVDSKVNIVNKLEDYNKSKTLIQVKQELLENKWPEGCERCRIEEQTGVESKRQNDLKNFKDAYETYNLETGGFLTASVAFGNTCNLACITCGPASSSKWQQEYMELTGQNVKPYHFYKKDFVSQLLNVSPNILHIDIPGGEPLLSGVKEQQFLLNSLIRTGRSSEISLHYTTNGTIWPNDLWWDLWKKFKTIEIQLSIDGINDHFEYIRYPAKWPLILENIIRYQDNLSTYKTLKLTISHTVSAYNIYYLPDFITWSEDHGFNNIWLGRVFEPKQMSPTVWPSSAKMAIIDKLSKGNHQCQTWASIIARTDTSDFFNQFRYQTIWHDKYRNLNFKKTFPDMARFF